MSLDVMAQKMREGRLDKDVSGWARGVLKAAGIDGRDGASIEAQGAALLNALRAATVYTPDAYGAEVISSAAGTLCLRPNLCLNGGDCFPAGTLLLRDDYELVPIEKIRPGDRIWGHDKWTRVKALDFKGLLSVDAIGLNNGSTMYLTGGHKIFVGRCRHERLECPSTCGFQRVGFERIRISDLREGMVLLQPDRISFGEGMPDVGRAYIEGLYVSEGWAEDGRFAISGRDGCRKEALKHEVKAICERLGVSTYWHKKYIRISDDAWATQLAQLGTRARFKHVASMNLGEAAAAALLRGVMSDSAANTNGPGRTFSTTSRHLMVQMRVLQRMFGVSTSVRMLTPEQHGGAGKHNLWRVGIRVLEKNLAVRSIDRVARNVPCWDVQTEDHYVYLPEHDVVVSNCDDLTVALGSATLSIGIPTCIVKQSFGEGTQEHVLLAIQDEAGEWLYADPSTRLPFGRAPHAQDEVWINPMEPIGDIGAAAPEIVTLGAPRLVAKVGSVWYEKKFGKFWRNDGNGWIDVTPNQGTGVGSFVGYATVSDLRQLLDSAAYFLAQLQAAQEACPDGWSDAAAWAQWQSDLAQCQTDFNAATIASNDVINSTPSWLEGVNVITYQWGMVKAVIDEEIDLDRRWRESGTTCADPTYPNTPQPVNYSGDVDQWLYNESNSAIQGIEAVARNAVKPATIAVVGIALGVVGTIAGLYFLDRILPSRR